MAKLTNAQRDILWLLSKRAQNSWPPTGPEISDALAHVPYWAAGKLRSLEARELVVRLGQSSSGGWCWQITDEGRTALAKEPTP